MEPTNLTVEILKGIRDEVRGVRDEVKALSGEVAELGERIDGVGGRVESLAERQVHMETGLATELLALSAIVELMAEEVRGLRSETR